MRGIPIDYVSPEGVFSINVQAEAMKMAKKQIVQAMVNGKYRKVNEGKLIGCYPSWGYRLTRRNREEGREASFEVDENEAWKIRKCFEVYLQDQSLHQAVRTLFNMGIYARGRKGEEGKKQVAILPRTLKQILQNESYIGNFWFGKKVYCQPTRIVKEYSKTRARGGLTGWKWRPRDQWKLVKIPAIIDKGVFERVRIVLDKRKKDFFRGVIHEYLCSGLIKCGFCGKRFGGRSSGKANKNGWYSLHYACRDKYNPQHRCPAPIINAREVDDEVWARVERLINDPEFVKKSIRELIKSRQKERTINEKELERLKIAKQKIEDKKMKILDLYIEETFSKKELDSKVAVFGNDEKLLNKQIAEVRDKLIKMDSEDVLQKEAMETCLKYQKIQNKNFEIKRFIVNQWVKEIKVLSSGELDVVMRVPELDNIPFDMDSFLNRKSQVQSVLTGNKTFLVII